MRYIVRQQFYDKNGDTFWMDNKSFDTLEKAEENVRSLMASGTMALQIAIVRKMEYSINPQDYLKKEVSGMEWSNKIRPTAIMMAGMSIIASSLGSNEVAMVLAGAAGTLCVDGAPPVVPADVVLALINKD